MHRCARRRARYTEGVSFFRTTAVALVALVGLGCEQLQMESSPFSPDTYKSEPPPEGELSKMLELVKLLLFFKI